MSLLGIITPSFYQLFESEVEELRKNFQRALLDKDHRDALSLSQAEHMIAVLPDKVIVETE